MKRKILVAIDGSTFSSNALNYLSNLFADMEEITVHLLWVVANSSAMTGMEWLDERDKMTMISPQVRIKLSAAKRFMQEAVLQLGRHGIAPKQISTEVKLSKMGVAADILSEAQKGLYDALLIGRRGISKIEEVFMGSSLSVSMTEKCYNIPLWIVDGKVHSKKFLLPVDSSFNSLKAADHLGFILQGNSHAQVSLLYFSAIVGGNTAPEPGNLSEMWGQEWCDHHLNQPNAIFHAPEQILLDRGMNKAQIHRLDQEICLQPHSCIVRHGNKNDYGTIVIGRRAKRQRGIFKGVSESVLNMAKHTAIWMIG